MGLGRYDAYTQVSDLEQTFLQQKDTQYKIRPEARHDIRGKMIPGYFLCMCCAFYLQAFL